MAEIGARSSYTRVGTPPGLPHRGKFLMQRSGISFRVIRYDRKHSSTIAVPAGRFDRACAASHSARLRAVNAAPRHPVLRPKNDRPVEGRLAAALKSYPLERAAP